MCMENEDEGELAAAMGCDVMCDVMWGVPPGDMMSPEGEARTLEEEGLRW